MMREKLARLVYGCLFFASACVDTSLQPSQGDVPESYTTGEQIISRYSQEGDHFVSPVLDAPQYANRVGLLVTVFADTDPAIRFLARGVDQSGHVGDWVAAEITWKESTRAVASADLGLVAVAAQIAVPVSNAADIAELTWSAVVPRPQSQPAPGTVTLGQSPQAQQSLDGYLAAAGVLSRQQWGARARTCGTQESSKSRMAIHHTAGNTGVADYAGALRGTQAYHMDTRGWCDIGYHFVVTSDGRVWEGREASIRGGHVANDNTGNIGIVFMGCFSGGGCVYSSGTVPETSVTSAMISSAGGLVRTLADWYGIAVNRDRIRAHRGYASTDCPGSSMYARIDDILLAAAGNSSRSGEDPPTEEPDEQPPVAPPTASGTVLGVVWDIAETSSPSAAGNIRLTGASVTMQGVGGAQVRSSDAFWSFDLAPGTYTLTVSAPGYQTVTQQVTVVADAVLWNSVGLLPQSTTSGEALRLTVAIYQSQFGPTALLHNAEVLVLGQPAQRTDQAGRAVFMVPLGEVVIQVSKEGYQTITVSGQVSGSSPLIAHIGLEPLSEDPTSAGNGDSGNDNDNSVQPQPVEEEQAQNSGEILEEETAEALLPEQTGHTDQSEQQESAVPAANQGTSGQEFSGEKSAPQEVTLGSQGFACSSTNASPPLVSGFALLVLTLGWWRRRV